MRQHSCARFWDICPNHQRDCHALRLYSFAKSQVAGCDTAPLGKLDLRQRFLNWMDSLPEISRYRFFSMLELEDALGTQGKYLSPVLLNLGWSRKRKWTGSRHYLRYWVPPANSDGPRA